TTEGAVSFCVSVIDSSGVADKLEALINKRTGRKRCLSVRAVLVALLLLAIDDRALHLKAATKLLFLGLPATWRAKLGAVGEALGRKPFLARYRQVRYLFHLVLSVIDPSVEAKDRVLPVQEAEARRKKLSPEEVACRQERLERFIGDLLEASVKVCSDQELSGYDGSVGLDATPVRLWSRGPSKSAGTCAADPDGGWYVREGDHRDRPGPDGKALRKICWALDADIVTMGRPPGAVPAWPNLALGVALGKPGHGPARKGVKLLSDLRQRGWPAGYLGADRGYTQCLAEEFHLSVRALGYRLVMDYKAGELGRQANSQGAVMVEGAFYCPAMPEQLVSASADKRAGSIDEVTYKARLAAREQWRLVRKQGPDQDGYERFSCPAQAPNPHLCCPLRPEALPRALGKVPVLSPPELPPKICTQSAITVSPDVGARHRQDLAFATEKWARTYATYRNSIEGLNGYVKDPAHEALAEPGRRRVRGIAAQSIFVTLLLMASNFRKVAAFRRTVAEGRADEVAERARRRRVSVRDYRPPP
ncbi:MAG: hypothetical protein ACP5VR_04650, partial [Acidimicrobiales bacterium]